MAFSSGGNINVDENVVWNTANGNANHIRVINIPTGYTRITTPVHALGDILECEHCGAMVLPSAAWKHDAHHTKQEGHGLWS